MRAIVVGLGGIGSNLVDPLCRTILFSKSDKVLKKALLIDGDKYESKNRERQRYTAFANKAEATKEWLKESFPELEIEARSQYVDKDNIFFIKDGDVVFLAVDNHATRKLVSDHIGILDNALLISGGNEEFDGNIQIYERRNGQDFTPPLTYLHPEIENPKDKNPATVNCGEAVVAGGVQLLAVNLKVASLMIEAFTLWLLFGDIPYTEVYANMKTGNVRPAKRIVD